MDGRDILVFSYGQVHYSANVTLDSIVAPTVVDLDKVSEWTEQKEVLQNEISQIKFKYQQHLDSFKNNSQVLHEAIEELPSLSGTEVNPFCIY